MEVVGEASRVPEVFPVIAEHQPDVTLLDLRMPGGSAMDVIERVRTSFPTVRILLLTMYDDPAFIRAAIAAGTYAVAVPGDHSRKHDFTGARLVIDSLNDARLLDLLRANR